MICSCTPEPERVHVLTGRRVLEVSEVAPPKQTTVTPVKDTSYLEHLFSLHQLVNVRSEDSSIQVGLRYADTLNFLGRNIYDGLRNAYLTCDMVVKLCNAQHHLKTHDSTLSLKVLDAARPLHVQQAMWDSLNMRRELKRKYLSPPEVTSLHNYGCAVDITLVDVKTGAELDMGSDFDEFERISQPRYEYAYAASGQLSEQALYNRSLLRHVMDYAGLRDIATEWWHFSLCTKSEASQAYELIR